MGWKRGKEEEDIGGLVELRHFEYCCSFWGCYGSIEITQLQKLQNCAARAITSSSLETPSRAFIQKLGQKTIEEVKN